MFLRFIKHFLRRNSVVLQQTPISPDGCVLIGDPANLSLGNQVTLGGEVVLYANERISIGDDTMIGMKTIIHTSTHDYNQHPMWRYRIDRPIRIGKHVWVGASCIILAGVIVEDYAVIAAGSVVTANVPKGAIVGGNPARIIKLREPAIYNASSSIESISDSVPRKEGYLVQYMKNKSE